MSRCYKGMQKRISGPIDQQPNALFVHWVAHNLNLVINDAVQSIGLFVWFVLGSNIIAFRTRLLMLCCFLQDVAEGIPADGTSAYLVQRSSALSY